MVKEVEEEKVHLKTKEPQPELLRRECRNLTTKYVCT